MIPLVSIVIVNYNHPENIDVCLHSLAITEGVDYEVVVLDNGSDVGVDALLQYKAEGLIDTLVLEETNHFYSGGNNIGYKNTNPDSKYVLLLNSDVGILRPDWLTKMIAWAEGTIEVKPTIWGLNPTVPQPGPRDIVSIGWSHDANIIPKHARPEGWCVLMRRPWWEDMSSDDFPFHGGAELMFANLIRQGAKCGVLCNYSSYLVHREGGSGVMHPDGKMKGILDTGGWYTGLEVETLDFTLDCPHCPGPVEHSSYTEW